MDINTYLDNKVQQDVILAPFTTFKIGGPAKYFYIAKNNNDLVSALTFAKKLKIKTFVLGGGSNL